MALILNIDTATEHASVCLSKDGNLLALEESTSQKEHASFIQPAIEKLLKTAGCQLCDVDAVAVSNGPGSYTGLRVGLSSAKGLCYALNRPLILISTLEIIASAAVEYSQPSIITEAFICPMIDARRMEVFTATYDYTLTQISPPAAMILDEKSFSEQLKDHHMIFCGSGAAKFENVIQNPNAIFSHIKHDARHMQTIAQKKYLSQSFADIAYSEPFYLKEFYNVGQKIKSD
jgi:tRNA threonylcarbamoyladenosine biosynthesis protein TsaB